MRKSYQKQYAFIGFCSSKLHFEILYCSEARSLTYPLRKGLITDWTWSGAFALPNPLIKAWSGLKHFLSQILYGKTRLQTGAGLKHFPLHILYEKARLQTGAVEAFSFINPLWKGQITNWSSLELEAFFITNPLWTRGDHRLELFWSTFPYKSFMNKPDYRLELMWSTFPCKSLTKGFGNDWLQAGAGLHYFPLQIPYEDSSYEKGGLRIGAVLKHLPLQILYEKVWLQTRAGLEHFPLQILDAKVWLYTWAVLKRSPLQIHGETAGNYKSEMITFEKSFKNHRSKFD